MVTDRATCSHPSLEGSAECCSSVPCGGPPRAGCWLRPERLPRLPWEPPAQAQEGQILVVAPRPLACHTALRAIPGCRLPAPSLASVLPFAQLVSLIYRESENTPQAGFPTAQWQSWPPAGTPGACPQQDAGAGQNPLIRPLELPGVLHGFLRSRLAVPFILPSARADAGALRHGGGFLLGVEMGSLSQHRPSLTDMRASLPPGRRGVRTRAGKARSVPSSQRLPVPELLDAQEPA